MIVYVNGDADSTYGLADTGWRRGLTISSKQKRPDGRSSRWTSDRASRQPGSMCSGRPRIPDGVSSATVLVTSPSADGQLAVRYAPALIASFGSGANLFEVRAVDGSNSLPVDHKRYRWTCAYSDAQLRFPERFVLAMFEDARALAQATIKRVSSK